MTTIPMIETIAHHHPLPPTIAPTEYRKPPLMVRGIRRVVTTLMLMTAAAAVVGCGPGGGNVDSALTPEGLPMGWTRSQTGPIAITVTTGQVGDLVRQIGGGHVVVTQLMGEGVDPHQYKPNQHDVQKLSGAEAIFYNGLSLEGRMGDLFVRMARQKPVIAVSERITQSDVLEADDGAHFDPHVWFDPRLWKLGAEAVRDALSAIEPAHKAEFWANAEKLGTEILGVYEWGQQRIAEIPEQRRVLITAHDAFQYFGRAFGLEVHGIQGISTDAEASVSRIPELVEFIVSRGVKAVFVESSVNEKNMQALIDGCKARGHQITIGGQLFSDAMGAVGTETGTYVGMLRANITTIVEALK